MALSALLLLAVAAQAAPEADAKAEADPYLLYGGYYGHGLGYGYGYGYPYSYGYYGKREAEAEPAVVAPVACYPAHYVQDHHPHRGDQRCCYQRCRPCCRWRLQWPWALWLLRKEEC